MKQFFFVFWSGEAETSSFTVFAPFQVRKKQTSHIEHGYIGISIFWLLAIKGLAWRPILLFYWFGAGLLDQFFFVFFLEEAWSSSCSSFPLWRRPGLRTELPRLARMEINRADRPSTINSGWPRPRKLPRPRQEGPETNKTNKTPKT